MTLESYGIVLLNLPGNRDKGHRHQENGVFISVQLCN